MIQLTPQQRLLIYTQAVDFRKGIDGLIGLCRSKLQEDPYGGTVFVFRNTRRTAVKLLVYDGSGFCLIHKRFSRGKLQHWPTDQSQPVCAVAMMVLLNQGQWVTLPTPWRPLPSATSSSVV